MKPRYLLVAAALVGSLANVALAADGDAPIGPYDGRWAVSLTCADTQDRNGLVKGYAFTFVATIAGGQLKGQYGSQGAPSSLVFSGDVTTDGTLEIRATGNSGSADTTIGRIPRGTPYGYTLAGKLGPTRGQAERRENRPCTATLGKL